MTTENEDVKKDETTTTEQENAQDTPKEEKPREVSDLLKLSTYQGMTDAEIQSLIDYWKETGYTEGASAVRDSNLKENLEKMAAYNKTQAQNLDASFTNAVALLGNQTYEKVMV